jgi:hypothetical protein
MGEASGAALHRCCAFDPSDVCPRGIGLKTVIPNHVGYPHDQFHVLLDDEQALVASPEAACRAGADRQRRSTGLRLNDWDGRS